MPFYIMRLKVYVPKLFLERTFFEIDVFISKQILPHPERNSIKKSLKCLLTFSTLGTFRQNWQSPAQIGREFFFKIIVGSFECVLYPFEYIKINCFDS